MKLPTIDLRLGEKLKNSGYRRKFFLLEASASIARQLIALRKRRRLSQKDLAAKADMKQPAVSRVESADYHAWSFTTLRRLADAMDARLKVVIEPYEDVLKEYDPANFTLSSDPTPRGGAGTKSADADFVLTQVRSLPSTSDIPVPSVH